MAKKKNKGFSLIEVVIAVAVLGLLITPILTQIVQTSNTSRRAKERQAAVENAEYIMNFIQRTDKSELDNTSSDGLDNVAITSKTKFDCECKLIDTEGNEIVLKDKHNQVKTLSYTATVYTLDDVKLGPKSNEYSRKVILDDLNNCVLAEGYQILYDKSQFTGSLDGFTVTNEGSLVKYNPSTPDLVYEVVCVPRSTEITSDPTYKYTNPNEVSLGFIQDLDSTKVAIIQGIASNFDSQVSAEFFSQKMNHLQMINEDEFKTVLKSSSNVYQNDTSSVRLLYVSITAHKTNDDKIDYYEVKCDACYYDATMVLNNGFNLKLKYNVFAKKFYTSKSPDIYLIYEPYVSDTNECLYAYNDFIEVYNDEDTKDSKLYLIKPETNQLSAISGYETKEDGSYELDTDGNKIPIYVHEDNLKYVAGNYFLTKDDEKEKPVNINLNAVYKSGESDTKKIIHTYTNIDINKTEYGWKQFSTDNTVHGTISYYVDNEDKVTGLTELRSMPLATGDKAESYPSGHLHMLSEDTNKADRLFTATVIMRPKSGDMDDVKYSAGKGVN